MNSPYQKKLCTLFQKHLAAPALLMKKSPFVIAKMIGRSIPDSLFVPVYYLPHDFLKESNKSEVQVVLDKLADWLP